MKTYLRFLPLAALAVLSTSCHDDPGCDPQPEPTGPSACTTGKVLGHTCSAGTLIQTYGGQVGQTIQYNDGSGLKTYHFVIATYTDLGGLSAPGTRLTFTYQRGGTGTPPEVQCLAFDAPANMPRYTLSNLSARGCYGDSLNTQTRQF